MTRPWIVVGVVALLGVLVGALIAGVPERSATAPDLGAPTTTVAAPTTTEAAEVEETTTSTAAATTVAPSTTAAPQETTTVPPSTQPLPERDQVAVVVANGAGIGGLAGDSAEVLRAGGYSDVRTADGTEIFGRTVVYFAEGSGELANRLAADFSLVDVFVVPLEGAPTIAPALDGASVLVYLGEDAQFLDTPADE